uniref:uncharacterized protein isoform X2 n=1 Tax=Myxine glutinosa TaxID=7769 RepID=UPI00358E1BA0
MESVKVESEIGENQTALFEHSGETQTAPSENSDLLHVVKVEPEESDAVNHKDLIHIVKVDLHPSVFQVPKAPRNTKDKADAAKALVWRSFEVEELLALWTEKNTQTELASSARNEKVFRRISAQLLSKGVDRTPKQCREKVRKLKFAYKQMKDHNKKSGVVPKIGRYYQTLDAVLGNRPATVGKNVFNSASLFEETAISPHPIVEEEMPDNNKAINETAENDPAVPSPAAQLPAAQSPAAPSSVAPSSVDPSSTPHVWNTLRYRTKKRKSLLSLTDIAKKMAGIQERQFELEVKRYEEEKQRYEEDKQRYEEERQDRRQAEENSHHFNMQLVAAMNTIVLALAKKL